MSFASDLEDDQPLSQIDENQQNGTGLGVATAGKPQTQTDISLGGGGSGVVTPGGGPVGNGQSAQVQAQKPSSSGSWTNLQSYLDANADQAASIGNQIAGDVDQKAQTAKNDVDSASSDFANNVNASTVAANPDRVNQAISDATNLKAGETLDPGELADFQAQRTAAYNGPTDFTKAPGYQQAQADINAASRAIDQTSTEAGRDVLLQDKFRNTSENGYNQGEKNLDQMLLENNPDNQAAFGGLRDRWSGLSGLLSGTTATQNAAAQNAVSTDSATAAAAQAAWDQANSTLQSGINDRAAAATAANADAYSQIQAALKANQFTPEQLQALGLTAGQKLYGVDLSNPAYLTPGAAPTIYNEATADQYAQAQALAALAGAGTPSYLPQEYLSQAGTPPAPYNFNSDALKTDIALGENAYNTALNAAENSPVTGGAFPGEFTDPTTGKRYVVANTPASIGADPQGVLQAWLNYYAANHPISTVGTKG